MSEQNNDQKEEVAKIDEVSDEALLRACTTQCDDISGEYVRTFIDVIDHIDVVRIIF